jgi:hypothetical protein
VHKKHLEDSLFYNLNGHNRGGPFQGLSKLNGASSFLWAIKLKPEFLN